jgi:hypothetical protein
MIVVPAISFSFTIVNLQFAVLPVTIQFLVDPIPASRILSVPAPALLPLARVMLERESPEAPAAQGVTALITPLITDPVKSEPPSPPAPPITKASRLAGLPTESIWPASTRLCALTTGPALGPLWEGRLAGGEARCWCVAMGV